MSRYRLQGSIIGSYTNPTSTSASGVYDVSAASKYTSANLWSGTTPIASSATLASNVSLVANSTGATYTTTSDNYGVFTFTGAGTFTPSVSGNIELLLVGGGGASYYANNPLYYNGGGGGAGGAVYYGAELHQTTQGTSLAVIAGVTYTITIGAGASQASTTSSTRRGSNSTFVGGIYNITAYGGGAGHGGGGGGGGGAGTSYPDGLTISGVSLVGGAGSTNIARGGTGYSGQGYDGGNRLHGGDSGGYAGGGGGGAGSKGGTAGAPQVATTPTPAASRLYSPDGGNGIYTKISGTATYYGGGGGGGLYSGIASIADLRFGYGGLGGGGNGSDSNANPRVDSSPGQANTGGGGGGPSFVAGNGTGGSGICIIRYPLVNAVVSASAGAWGYTQGNLIGMALGNYITGYSPYQLQFARLVNGDKRFYKLLSDLTTPGGAHTGGPGTISASKGGKYLIYSFGTSGYYVYKRKASEGGYEYLTIVSCSLSNSSVHFNPAREDIVALTDSDGVHVYSLVNDVLTELSRPPGGPAAAPGSVQWSWDGTKLAAGGGTASVGPHIWSLSGITLTQINVNITKPSSVATVAWTRDSQKLLVCTSGTGYFYTYSAGSGAFILGSNTSALGSSTWPIRVTNENFNRFSNVFVDTNTTSYTISGNTFTALSSPFSNQNSLSINTRFMFANDEDIVIATPGSTQGIQFYAYNCNYSTNTFTLTQDYDTLNGGFIGDLNGTYSTTIGCLIYK